MSQYKHALVIGASSGVGRALSIELARLGCRVTLLARDIRDLEATATHIRLAYGTEARSMAMDLEAKTAFNYAEFDAVFVVAGVSLTDDDINTLRPEASGPVFNKIMNVNLMGPGQMLLNSFLSFKGRSTKAYIGVCSSIAAPVPRSRNLVYAAAKNGLESLVQSLQHAAAGSNVRVQYFRIGYVDSNLSYGQTLLFPSLTPQTVAKKMISASKCPNRRLVYLPGYWRIIILGLKSLPWPVFSRLKF